MDKDNLGPAERILQTVLAYSDHLIHNWRSMGTCYAQDRGRAEVGL
jgi:hypothetical protein